MDLGIPGFCTVDLHVSRIEERGEEASATCVTTPSRRQREPQRRLLRPLAQRTQGVYVAVLMGVVSLDGGKPRSSTHR